MIITSKSSIGARVGWTCLLAGLVATTCSAQSDGEKKAPAKIQGESIAATGGLATNLILPPAVMSALSATTNTVPRETNNLSKGYLSVEFDQLSAFDFDPPDLPDTNVIAKIDPADKLIPDSVKALDKAKAIVTGYMIPEITDGDKTTEFLIVRNPMGCCFGAPPKLNELIEVKALGKGVDINMGDPVSMKGTLHVGTTRESGGVTSIYKLDGEGQVGE